MSQIEPLAYQLLLENSDDRVLDGVFQQNSGAKFSFESESYNETIVKMAFVCATEKFEEIDEDDNIKAVKKTAVFDNLISQEDYYLENLTSFFRNGNRLFTLANFKLLAQENFENFMTKDMINFILNTKEDLWRVRDFYVKDANLSTFFKESCVILENCSTNIKKSFEHNQENIFYQQIVIYQLGLFTSVINFWKMLKTIPALLSDLKKQGYFEKIVTSITKLISILNNDNPFLIALNFNKNVLNLYFEKGSKMETNTAFLQIYIHMMKTMIKYNYKLELSALVERIIPNDILINKVREYLIFSGKSQMKRLSRNLSFLGTA
jgi:hypothetical protein